ncbi:MAG: hypothetical protein ABI145_01475 [Steroidobacteraceae bacterium]
MKLEVAEGNNLPYRFWQAYTNFETSDAAITYLKLNREQFAKGQRVFRIVDSSGAVVMSNLEIQDKVS